jgi:hypothetical protein
VQIGSKKNEAYKVRCFKIQELIDTEKSYLRSLNIAITVHNKILTCRSHLLILSSRTIGLPSLIAAI